MLEATDSPKYRAIFMLAYGAGLRVSEITAPRACDIDSGRMIIHVLEGKTGPRAVIVLSAIFDRRRRTAGSEEMSDNPSYVN